MLVVADDEPPSIADLAVFQRDGRAWVVSDEVDRPVGYLLLAVVDANAHVKQVSVHPAQPAELDLMARLAGLRLTARWSDWARASFDQRSPRHISVYERP